MTLKIERTASGLWFATFRTECGSLLADGCGHTCAVAISEAKKSLGWSPATFLLVAR